MFQGAWTKDNQNKNLRHGPWPFDFLWSFSALTAVCTRFWLAPASKHVSAAERPWLSPRRAARAAKNRFMTLPLGVNHDCTHHWCSQKVRDTGYSSHLKCSSNSVIRIGHIKYCRRAKFLNVQTTSEHIRQVGLSIWMRAKLLSPLPFSAQKSGKHPAFEHPN